jgi:hypothetical protein
MIVISITFVTNRDFVAAPAKNIARAATAIIDL